MEDIKKKIKNAISTNQIEEFNTLIGKVCNDEVSTSKEDALKELLNESLYHAALLGRYEIVKNLVKNGADVNYEDPLKQSLFLRGLMSAKSHESDEILKFLLQNGSNINHRSRNGQSDFMFLLASDRLSYSFLVQFIDCVCNINETDLRTGGSYLHLISNRPDDENKSLIMKKLLEKGLAINGKDNNDDTPLHSMASIADCGSMVFLVENGADIYAKNRLGETVLHTLASSNEFEGFHESLDYLMEMRIDVNNTDLNGKTAIHHALMSKDTEESAIEQFLKLGVQVNVKDTNGRNELYVAVEQVDIEYSTSDLDRRAAVIKVLANAGVDVSEGDMYGVTPLHLATAKGDLEILVALINAGANVLKKSNSGATALHWSCCGTYNMVHVIIHCYLNEGHDINVVDMYGATALHWAVWLRKSSAAQSLLQVGSDYTIKDDSGNTPVDLAKKLFFTDFLDLVEDEKYKSLEGLSLQDRFIKCNGNNLFRACPLLRYIAKEDGKLGIDLYIEHLKKHETSMVRCVDASLDIKDMGLFYDIEENISVPQIIENLMQFLSKRVGEHNSLFRCELRLSGSVFEGTKVNIPDEFDYLWIFTEFSQAFSPVDSPSFPESFVKLRIKSNADEPRFRRYLTKESFLNSQLLIRDFHRTVNEELMNILKNENNDQFSNMMCVELLNEIFCTNSSLSFQFFGKEAKFFRISIDVVPTIWFQGWTPREFKTAESAPSRESEASPKFYVIIKTPDRCHVEDFSLFFRISYAYLEQCVMREVPKVIKKGYIVLKILAESGYFPKVVDHDNDGKVVQYVTSYHLKTCFLHEIELWKKDVDGEESVKECTDSEENRNISLMWAKRIVDRCKKSVQENFLVTLFEPKKNLLGLEGLEDVMTDPDVFVGMVNLLQHLIDIVDGSKEQTAVISSCELESAAVMI